MNTLEDKKELLIRLFLKDTPHHLLSYRYRKKIDGYKEDLPALDSLIAEGKIKQIYKDQKKVVFQYITH